MKKTKNLIGMRFGKLVVESRADDYIVPSTGGHQTRWKCICDCGNTKIIHANVLLSGRVKSCGCYKSEMCAISGRKSKKPENEYNLSGEYGIGYIYQKDKIVEFYFDLEDYEKIRQYRWSLGTNNYVICHHNNTTRKLHKVILESNKYEVIDHINRNPLDNRKDNLRISSAMKNAQNHNLPNKNKSGCSGVHKRTNKKWEATLIYNGKKYCLGMYDNLEDAIMARLLKEVEVCDDLEHRTNTELMKKYNLIK